MIRRTVVGLVATLALVFGAASGAGAATVSDVDGLWAGVDIDGSNQLMLIAGSEASLRLLLFDDDATVCGGGPVLAFGSGSLTGDVVSATYRLWCFNGTTVGPASITYTFDAASGTLLDGVGATWFHVFG